MKIRHQFAIVNINKKISIITKLKLIGSLKVQSESYPILSLFDNIACKD